MAPMTRSMADPDLVPTPEMASHYARRADAGLIISEATLIREDAQGYPAAGCSVVVFYIDGLRPDVLEEMSAMHHVPYLTKYFVEGGTHLSNTFTAFPSDTITSNGTMWTGCFSDRHGIKAPMTA